MKININKSFIFILFNILINCNLIYSNKLCYYSSYNKYQTLKLEYPEHSDKFEILSKIPLPVWVTDRDDQAFDKVRDTLDNCNGLTSIFILYALPNKDCKAGFSSAGSNKNNNDYINYINKLNDIVNNNNVIYIIEPDALALTLNNECGISNNYLDNIKNAINILSKNSNSKLYIDIGHWVLIYGEDDVKKIIDNINIIDTNNKLNGISINLSNYRSTSEMVDACNRFKSLSKKNYNCIIDTSRNWNGPSSDNQWCNLISAGIGEIPRANPVSNIDYYLWIKPQSELDGPCIGFSNSYQINKEAGQFDLTYFINLWNNGNTNLKKCFN